MSTDKATQDRYQEMRDWARDQGYRVAERGRLPLQAYEAYVAAHPEQRGVKDYPTRPYRPRTTIPAAANDDRAIRSLNDAERQLLTGLLRDKAIACRAMGDTDNGEDYVGTLRTIHSLARRFGIFAEDLEDT